MAKKKIITVLGARPQFIKASVVSNAIASENGLNEIVIHTGQHFDKNMSDVFFAELGMDTPEYFLDIHGGTHGSMTARMLDSIEKVLQTECPDLVLVYGDTNSTLAGALAAVKLDIPIAHVEAGLRSFNMKMPEEVNRVLTDRISNWLFTPTKLAEKNLICEGVSKDHIVPVGDVMFDVALHHGKRVCNNSGLMNELGIKEKNFALATIHRAENTDCIDRLRIVAESLCSESLNLQVVWPLHPRTRAKLDEIGMLEKISNKVMLIDPVGYLDMVQLEKFAAIIITDSGGVQKEAFFHRVPCITLREETEWMELVDSGWNKLVEPTDQDLIVKTINDFMGAVGENINPYGDGFAANHIVKKIKEVI